MPQQTRVSRTKAYFFAHPKQASAKVGGAFGVATLIGLLIPTCIELTPLGNTQRDAKADRDDAEDQYDGTLQQFNSAQAAIAEARQRVIDLDCAMAGDHQYNDRLIAFQQNLNDPQKTATARLNLWQLYFAPDSTTNEQSSTQKTYTDDEWEYDYYYSCIDFNCGKDSNGNTISCCYDSGYHWVTYEYDYDEVTTIINAMKNIIQGTPLSLPALNCGYYSRTFATFAPETYETYESPKVYSGDKTTGYTYVNFRREFGSRISARYRLDDDAVDTQITVLRAVTQADAATDLAQNLYKFLVTAIAAFNATGMNYPALQDSIRNSIPGLIDKAAAINATLQIDAQNLANKQGIYDQADHEFNEGETLWLPTFFLVPIGAALLTALLTYLIATQCKNRCTIEVEDDVPEVAPKDVEIGVITPPAPPVKEEPPALYDEGTASAPRL